MKETASKRKIPPLPVLIRSRRGFTWLCTLVAAVMLGTFCTPPPASAVTPMNGVIAAGNGRHSRYIYLMDDTTSEAEIIGRLAVGKSVLIFPDMSTPDFLYVMSEPDSSGDCQQGWVPREKVRLLASTEQPFTDLAGDSRAQKAVRKLVKSGIADRHGDQWRPDAKVTRRELALMLEKYVDKLEELRTSLLTRMEALPLRNGLSAEEAARVDALVKRLETIENSRRNAELELSMLRERVERNTSSIARLRKEGERRQRRVDALGRELGRLEGEVKAKASAESVAKLAERLDGVERDVSEIRSSVAFLKEKLEEMARKLDDEDSDLSLEGIDEEGSDAADERVQGTLANVTRQLQDIDKTLDVLTTKMDQVEAGYL